jgi:hypothetical protein
MTPPLDRIWPDIPYPAWRDTCRALHLMTQVVGKVRLAQTPWLNQAFRDGSFHCVAPRARRRGSHPPLVLRTGLSGLARVCG